jgi:enamine deaminase RidA (YjgF/YER057c/UK114 family)
MAHEILKLKSVHPTKGYSHAAKAGSTLYIAGQIAQDVDGNLVGKGDFNGGSRGHAAEHCKKDDLSDPLQLH